MLLDAAREIGPALAAQAEADEANGTLTAETVALLEDAGLFRMKLPRELGGFEADPSTQILVLEALAQANISAAWCTMVGATGISQPGAFLPDAAISEIFVGGRAPRCATVGMPMGKATPVEGGYRLSGRWPFASGVRHSEWISTTAMVDRNGRPEPLKVVIPTTSVQLHDNWQVMGLKGTGSCDFSAEDLFAPSAFTWPQFGETPKRGGPLYRLGMPGYVANEHAGVALGIARCALDRFIEKETARTRSYVPGGTALAARATTQRSLGQMELRLRAAKLLALDVNDAAWDTVQAGETVSVRQQCELRAAATYCTEVALDIVKDVFRQAGGSAIYLQNVLQQCLRDINVAAQHRMVSEATYENLGQILLGVADVNPMR